MVEQQAFNLLIRVRFPVVLLRFWIVKCSFWFTILHADLNMGVIEMMIDIRGDIELHPYTDHWKGFRSVEIVKIGTKRVYVKLDKSERVFWFSIERPLRNILLERFRHFSKGDVQVGVCIARCKFNTKQIFRPIGSREFFRKQASKRFG